MHELLLVILCLFQLKKKKKKKKELDGVYRSCSAAMM